MTTWADIKPTEGDVANTFEYMFDIAPLPEGGLAAVQDWTNVPDITGLNPQFAPKMKDITTYADKGSTSQKKVGNDFTLDFQILKVRDQTGKFQPEWKILKDASDASGSANNIAFRYYDALGAEDAYMGVAAVTRANRPSTANDDPGFDAFTLTGRGEVAPISNPVDED